MSIVLLLPAAQSDSLSQATSHPVAAWYLLVALVGAVLALVVTILIRSSVRGARKH